MSEALSEQTLSADQLLPPVPPKTYFIDGQQLTPTEDQFNALETMLAGHNVFLTGEPGTGKSALVKMMKYEFIKNKKSVAYLGPTGLSALNIGGATVHSFFKFPIRPMDPYFGEGHGKSFKVRDLIQSTDILVIDEISMVRSDVFTAMDWTCRSAKNNNKPFGGLQVIVVGDFFQVPPVVSDNNLYPWLDHHYGGRFCCQCSSWAVANFVVCALLQSQRQRDDDSFVNALRMVRHKEFEGLMRINQLAEISQELKGTIITFTNESANTINQRKLRELDRESFTYLALKDDKAIAPVDQEIVLKVGARVMLMANTGVFVNGDIGTIIQLNKDSVDVNLDRGLRVNVEYYTWEAKTYVSNNGKLEEQSNGNFSQLPIRLGWAITAHKSQGQTLDHVTMLMDSRPFEQGQLYVALSRVRSAKNLTLCRPLDGHDLV